jgi:hypothetical protein
VTVAGARQLRSVVEGLDRTPLAEALQTAELQTRVDRKYLIVPAMLHAVVVGLGPGAQVVDIDGEHCFAYRSVYFDTADRLSYRKAAHRRPDRFKVRTRTYVDQGRCFLEVKRRDARGRTTKVRVPYDPADEHRLTPTGRAFVDEHVCPAAPLAPLLPTLTTEYHRVTLLDRTRSVRLTLDAGVVCRSTDGREVRLADAVVVETKSTGAPTAADRLLWRTGTRPVAISKYAVGMAALDPSLPANRWNRVLTRWVDAPARQR